MGQESNENVRRAVLAEMGLDSSGVRRGTRVVPLLGILAAFFAFFIWGLPSGAKLQKNAFAALCLQASETGEKARGPQADPAPDEPLPQTLAGDSLKAKCYNGEDVATASAIFSGKDYFQKSHEVGLFFFEEPRTAGFREFRQTFAAVTKTYFEQLTVDFKEIAKSLGITIVVIALFSVMPGLLGSIYRRNFWGYFIAAFIGLYAFNAWGGFGSITDTKAMPGSVKILLFIITQLFVLLLANRLRRHTNGSSRLPPKVYNALVALVLLAVAYACYEGLGPWRDAATGVSAIWTSVGLGSGFYKWEFILIVLPIIYMLLRQTRVWTQTGSKNIVACIDGTSNTPDQFEAGLLAQTNVFKLFKMLKSDSKKEVNARIFDASITKRYGERQIAFYYTGVGNRFESSAIGQIVGQATGMGAADIVERAYLDIMRIYRPGDRIFIFGFSRGAAIARLLAKAIDARAAPRTVWTLRFLGRHWLVWKSRPVPGKSEDVPTSVLGCWDTVGAFGIAKTIAGINFQKIDLFKDLTVPDSVEQAYHMVALDEMRDSFVPTLMDPDPIHPGRIVEVWFSGDHANVGGGWGTTKLSDVTLDFLLTHVSSGYAQNPADTPGDESWGLYLTAVNSLTVKVATEDAEKLNAIQPDPLGQLRQWTSVLYTYEPRKLPLHAVLSESVFQRMANALPVYAPQSLFDHNIDLEKKRETVRTEVARLAQTGSLSEDEGNSVLQYMDKLRLTRWPQQRDLLKAANVAPNPARDLANTPSQ